jgi:chemotaxis signal transduction protein
MTQGGSSRLFERSLPAGYRDELREMMAEEPPRPAPRERSILLFRLGPLRLALPVQAAFAISPVLHVSRIPHRSGTVLLGLVAFRGEIVPCCSLARLLDVAQEESGAARMLLLHESPGPLWATAVDAVTGISPSPECISQADAPLAPQWLNGAFAHQSGIYNQLDTNYLFRQITLATA